MNDPTSIQPNSSPPQEQPTLPPAPAADSSVTLPPSEVPDPSVTLPPSEGADRSALTPHGHPDHPPGYEILGELGRGGMGVVYKARQMGLNRLCALKMILAGGHAGEADLARFRTEAEAIARLQHPNIVAVFEIGAHQGRPFFSLEFCAGGSLDRTLNGVPISPRDAGRLVKTLAEAMQAAHDANVIHRDLKPANVLLTSPGRESGGGDSLTPKITDFGLAKKLDDVSQTQTGSIMGTPSYMAPEQAEGKKDIGPSVDIYALGAILYDCLTGRPPFRAATSFDTVIQVICEDPVAPKQLNAGIPRDLETITLKCLRKDPSKRYISARELAEDLGRFLADEPIKARRPTLGERVVRWARKQGRGVILTTAVSLGVLLLALGILAGWGIYTESRKGNLEIDTEAPLAEAEVLREDGTSVVRFRLPTAGPVRLDPGAYGLRLSASGLPAQTRNLRITPAGEHRFVVDPREQQLRPAITSGGLPPKLIRSKTSTHLALIERDRIRIVDGKTGRESILTYPPEVGPYQAVNWPDEFVHDLDGDGQTDVVGWTSSGLLFAFFKGKATVLRPVRNTLSSTLLGFLPAANGKTDVVLHEENDREQRLERVDHDGKVVWSIDANGLQLSASTQPVVGRLGLFKGRSAFIVVRRDHVLIVDPASGKLIEPVISLGRLERSGEVRTVLVDLDGDGSLDVLRIPKHGEVTASLGLCDAHRLTDKKRLWFDENQSMFLTVVPEAGGNDVLLISEDHQALSNRQVIIRRLKGGTGYPHQQARIIKNLRSSGRNFVSAAAVVGPDLDGDGESDLFTAVQTSGNSREAVYVHALSGAEERTLWTTRLPQTERVGKLILWPATKTSWPRVVVELTSPSPTRPRRLDILEGDTGKLLQRLDGAYAPVVSDLDGDGVPELIYSHQRSTTQVANEFRLPFSDTPRGAVGNTQPSRLYVIRGTPQPRRQWMGNWEAINDLDGDGIPEMLHRDQQGDLAVLSGSEGKLLWPNAGGVTRKGEVISKGTRLVASGSVLSLPLPQGDLNRDGVPDLIVVDTPRAMASADDRSRLLIPLRAVSGATGKTIWQAASLPIKGESFRVDWQPSPVVIRGQVGSAEGAKQMLALSRPIWMPRTDGNSNHTILVRVRASLSQDETRGYTPSAYTWLLSLDARDGTLKWNQMESILPVRGIGMDEDFQLSALPLRGTSQFLVLRRAVDSLGQPSRDHWLQVELRREGTTHAERKDDRFLKARGDIRPVVTRIEFPESRESILVRAGNRLQTYSNFDTKYWEYQGPPQTKPILTPLPPPVRVEDGKQTLIGMMQVGQETPSVVWFDATAKRPEGIGRTIPDLTGMASLPDGVLLLFKGRAEGYRGVPIEKNRRWVWTDPMNGDLEWVQVAGDSVVLQSKSNELIALNTKNGREAWRVALHPGEVPALNESGTSLALSRANGTTRLLTMQGTPSMIAAQAEDPLRRYRPLPWVTELEYELRGELLPRVLLSMMMALLLVVFPWYMAQWSPSAQRPSTDVPRRRSLMRRLGSLVRRNRGILIALLWIAIVIGGAYLLAPVALFRADGHLHTHADALLLTFAGTVMAIPLIVPLWAMVVAWRANRRRLIWFLASWVVCCIALVAYWLLGDAGQIDPEQRYTLDGWYLIAVPGLLLLGIGFLVGWILWLPYRGVCLMVGWFWKGKS